MNQLFAPLTKKAPTIGPISVARPPTAAQIAISMEAAGVITKNVAVVDTAKVGNFALTGVKKSGDSYFSGTAAGKGTGEIRSGYLEGSGVEAGRVMVDMMASMRAYEAGQKAIQTIDGTLQQAAGQLGTLPG